MYGIVGIIGSFVRWIFKGCKTSFKDEIDGNLKLIFISNDYHLENAVIGYVTITILISIILLVFFA